MSDTGSNEQNTQIAPGDKKSGIKLVAPAKASERAGEISFVDMPREQSKRLDVLVLNPPSPDGDLFLRDIARVGRQDARDLHQRGDPGRLRWSGDADG